MKLILLVGATLLCSLAAHAQMDVGMEFVTVGDPGNPHDPFTGNVRGSVGYVYKIGKYEVTNGQYVQFLNNADPLGGNLRKLHNNAMASGTFPIVRDLAKPMGQKYSVAAGGERVAVSNVDYYASIRFINWLHGGNTEDGAYALAIQEPAMDSIPRKTTAQFWMPNWDEWYKAAYYHGPNSALLPVYGTDYALYPMGGFSADNNAVPGDGESANFNGRYSGAQAVGSYLSATSHYGTFDQGGNLEEWFEHISGQQYPRFVGGGFTSSESALRSSNAANTSTTGEASTRGFRVAARVTAQPPPVVPALEAREALELRWQSQLNVNYQVQHSPDLRSWFNDGPLIIGTGAQLSSFRKIDDTRKFYHVIVSP